MSPHRNHSPGQDPRPKKAFRGVGLMVLGLLLAMVVGGSATAQGAPENKSPSSSPSSSQDQGRSQGVEATLTQEGRRPPVAFAVLLNPVETATSALVNKLVLVSPLVLLGDGRGACVINPQAYALTDGTIGGAGALVGFRIFSGKRYDGLYFGVRFGGGVGNQSFKTFMGQVDTGYTWAFGAFRIGLGVNAGGGYVAYRDTRGSLYLFSLDVSIGFAMGRFKSVPTTGAVKGPPAAR